jgi:hypothetical protein
MHEDILGGTETLLIEDCQAIRDRAYALELLGDVDRG